MKLQHIRTFIHMCIYEYIYTHIYWFRGDDLLDWAAMNYKQISKSPVIAFDPINV